MTKYIRTAIHKYSERVRVWTFLGCFFLVGLGVGAATTTWVGRTFTDARFAAYDRQVDRLRAVADAERQLNREQLRKLAEQMASNAKQMASNADKLDQITIKAQSAAKTAKGAATTANSAAKSAAKANIRITEIVPRKDLQLKENIK